MAAHSGGPNIQTPGGYFAGDQIVRIDSDVQPAWESESLPDWVNHWLIPMLSAGQKWPEASEAGLSELARRYAALSDGSMSSAEPAGLAVRTIVSGWATPATATFAGRARELYGNEGGISGVGNNARAYAVQASNFAVQTQYSKLTINVAFWVTVTAIAITLLAAFFSAGVSTPLIGPYAAAARAAISRILAKLVAAAGQKVTAAHLAKVAALSGPTGKALVLRLLASPFGRELVEEVGEEFFIEFVAQLQQNQMGTRNGFDWQQLAVAGLSGGTGAAAGSVVAGPLSRVTQVMPGFAGRALTTGATNVIASPVGGFVGNGLVYGQWSNPFTAESMVGAFMGGVGRTGTISPFSPDVALALADPVTTLASAYAAATGTTAASTGAPTGPDANPSHATVNVRTPDLATVPATVGPSSTTSTGGSSNMTSTVGSSSGATSRTSTAGSSSATLRVGADLPNADSSPRRHTPSQPSAPGLGHPNPDQTPDRTSGTGSGRPPAPGIAATPPPTTGQGPTSQGPTAQGPTAQGSTGQGSTGQGFTGQGSAGPDFAGQGSASPGPSPQANLHNQPQPGSPEPQQPGPEPRQPRTSPEPHASTTPAPHTGSTPPSTATGGSTAEGRPTVATTDAPTGHTTSPNTTVTAGEPAGPLPPGRPQPLTGPHSTTPPAQGPLDEGQATGQAVQAPYSLRPETPGRHRPADARRASDEARQSEPAGTGAADQAASEPEEAADGPAQGHASAVPVTAEPDQAADGPARHHASASPGEVWDTALSEGYSPIAAPHPRTFAEAAAIVHRWTPGAQPDPDRGAQPDTDGRPGPGNRPEPGAQPNPADRRDPGMQPDPGVRPDAEGQVGPDQHSGSQVGTSEDFSHIERLLSGETDDASEPQSTLAPTTADSAAPQSVAPQSEAPEREGPNPTTPALAPGEPEASQGETPQPAAPSPEGPQPAAPSPEGPQSAAPRSEAAQPAAAHPTAADPALVESGRRLMRSLFVANQDDTSAAVLGTLREIVADGDPKTAIQDLADRFFGTRLAITPLIELYQDAQRQGLKPEAARDRFELIDVLDRAYPADHHRWLGYRYDAAFSVRTPEQARAAGVLAEIMVTPDDRNTYKAFITPVLLAYGLRNITELLPVVREAYDQGHLPPRADGPKAFHDALRRFYQEDPTWWEGLRGQETYGLRGLDDAGIRLLGAMIRILPQRATARPSAPLPMETLAHEVGLAGSVAHVFRLARDAQEHGADPAGAANPRELADVLIAHKAHDPYLWNGLRLTVEHGLTPSDDDAVRVLARLAELAGPEPARPIWTFQPLRRLADRAGYGYDVGELMARGAEAVRNGFDVFGPVDREQVIDALRRLQPPTAPDPRATEPGPHDPSATEPGPHDPHATATGPHDSSVTTPGLRDPRTIAPGLHDLSPSAVREARKAAAAEYEQARKKLRGGSRLRRFLRPGSTLWWSPDPGMDELYLESLQARVQAWQRLPRAPEVSFTHDFPAYLRAYEAAARRAESGEPVIPYMYEDATAGLGARDGGRGFGVEIEFVLPPGESLTAIAEELHKAGLTGDADVHAYHTSAETGYRTGRNGGRGLWRLEEDSTVSGELVSPILYDEPETWENLRRACEIIRAHGGLATGETGGHVHVSAGDYDHLVANFVSVAEYADHHGDTLYRLGHNPEHEDHRGLGYCIPSTPPAEGYDSIELVRSTHEHHAALNLSAVNGSRRDHVEFRMWDGSLDPAIIQAQVKVSLALVEAAFRTAALGLSPNAGRREPAGSHAALRRLGSAPDLTEAGSLSFRLLMDELFWRASDKEQLTALYAITRWSPYRMEP
ncbi:amidoligase family protein [Nonomuraea sp. NPDC052634]|uniref:WXG100-like domain-containing protein n=2 Tax=Nonomuraea TaxID=83681 RepID=UPI003426E4A1